MANESDVVLNFKMDGQIEYATTIKEINQVMNTAAKEYKNHISAMGNDASATDKLTAAKRKLEIQLEGAEKRTRMLREEFEKSAAETGENSEQTKKLYDKLLQAETAENNLRNSLERTNAELANQGDAAEDTASKIEKIEEAGEKVKGVGEGMTKYITAPILALGAASMAAFSKLDDALDGITVATGATGKELESLQGSFSTVMGEIPAEMEDISTGIGEVNTQFGLMDKALEETTGRMLKFAEINDADVSGSTINAKKSMDLFRLSIDDLPMILDSVTKTSQNTGVGVDQLFDAVNKGAPQLKAMGLGFSESTTLIGQMEKAGIDSAGSLGYLAKASVVYAKDGKTMQDGLTATIDSIKNATTEQDKLTLASEVFGTKAASKMVEAIDSGALSMDGLADSAKNAAGTVDQTYNDILDPIDQATMAQNKMIEALGMVGEQIQIALLPAFNAAIDILSRFSEWFGSLDDGTKQMIITIAGIVAVIGPLLVILGTLMGSITKIMTAVQMLGPIIAAVTSPIGLVVIAIVALIAIFAILWIKCEAFRNFWIDMWQTIQTVFDGIITAIGGVLSSWIDGVVAQFKNVFDTIVGVLTGIIDFVFGVFTGDWKRAWEGIVQIFSSIVDGIVNAFKIPINTIIGMLNSFIRGINKVKIPKWVPKVGGKGIDIPSIPQLATGGHVLNGQAIVGEAGPELLSNSGGRTTVTPLSDEEKRKGIGGKIGGSTIEQTINIQNVNTSSVNEMNSMNRQIKKASEIAISGMRG
ncbi:phage tail tape measure protein [Carnobacterium maltaromaticum]|uniref:phage tail tape measure protein n=1 Tax=Carnobacterium maltaromaticum TaxID=2751 RepID=UPI0011445ED8|nr:phage tail tape measure protein [Carnobacterium maltaromaticum]GED50452.1 phage tail tape measure protein [Carnobacterium maltaromaticum]